MAISGLDEGSEFLNISGAILIGSEIYLKSSDSHIPLLDALKNAGYSLNNEKDGASFDESKLKHTVRCYHCSHVQDDCTGVAVTHNFPCASCKKPLNVDYERDGEVLFNFVRNNVQDRRQVTLRIFDYDTQREELLLFPEPEIDKFSLHNPLDVLTENSDRYTRRMVEVDKELTELIIIPVRNSPFMDPSDHIRKSHVSGGKRYYIPVTLFMGVAYDNNDLPLPRNISISTDYMDRKLDLHAPNAHEIILSIAGLSSRTTFYTTKLTLEQEPVYMNRMTAFVKNFVDVDFEAWNNFISTAPKQGADFINALAKWCAAQSDGLPRALNETTNFMNTVYAAQLQSEGLEIREDVAAAAYEGVKHLGKFFGTAVHIEDINPHNLMETVHTVIRGAEVNRLISTNKPKDAESGPH